VHVSDVASAPPDNAGSFDDKKMNKKTKLITCIITILILVGVVSLTNNPISRFIAISFFDPDFSYWQSEGEKIVNLLTAYKKKNGEYPDSLTPFEKVIKINTIYGPWFYEKKGDNYQLVLGDYVTHNWEIIYDSSDQSWMHDA